MEYALDGGVFAAGAMLEWMCNQLGLAEDPPALRELARETGTPPELGSCRGWRNRGALVAAECPRP